MSKLNVNTLFSVLNKDIPFGRALNALGHMCLGIGHKLPVGKMPAIFVHFSDSNSIHKIRALYQSELRDSNIIFSDFVDTMTGGTADEQLQKTASKQSHELQYYGATICADESIIQKIQCTLGGNYKILSGYTPFLSTFHDRMFEFLKQPIIDQGFSSQPYKASIVANKQLSTTELVNSVVRVSIEVGQKVDLASLRLLEFIDADNGKHPYISYHPFTILTAKNQSKLSAMAQNVSKTQGVASTALIGKDEDVSVFCAFSQSQLLEQCINKKDTSLLNKEISQDNFLSLELETLKSIFQVDEICDCIMQYSANPKEIHKADQTQQTISEASSASLSSNSSDSASSLLGTVETDSI